MKTKLILAVPKSVIVATIRYAKKLGKSISQLLEELFENSELEYEANPEAKRAAKRLLKSLWSAKPVKSLDDRQLLKLHVARKFT